MQIKSPRYTCPKTSNIVYMQKYPRILHLSWDSLVYLMTCPRTCLRHLQIMGQNDVPSVTLGTKFCPKTLCKTQFVLGQINMSCNSCRPS